MKTTNTQTYSLTIGVGLEKEVLEVVKREGAGRRLVIITDSHLKNILGKDLLTTLKKSGLPVELISFPNGETHKTQKTVSALQHELLKKRYGRDTLIVALGGGVVGDVAGFVAATFLRGVPYINIPTTLLSMVDSSIGGKVGIDTPYGKNMIGAFWPPRAVVMDTAYLAKLPAREIVNGLFEAVKTFLTSDAAALKRALSLDLQNPLQDQALLGDIIYTSAKFKAELTERDPREANERKIINFGHTIGHALELLSGYTLPHGYAVAYGMLAEAKISELMGVLSSTDRAEVFRALEHFGIKTADFPRHPITDIIAATKSDKKVRGGVPHYVLLSSIGSVYTKGGQFAHPVGDDIVTQALTSFAQ